MTTRNGRGGYRQPSRPAAVSGPGALSQRTDSGAGSKKQPLRVASGGAYGERQAATDQQQAAPMAGGGPATPAAGGSPVPSPAANAGGAFGPTQMPNEPNSAGASQEQDMMARNPQAVLRVLYSRFPHPSIARLIDWSSSGGNPE